MAENKSTNNARLLDYYKSTIAPALQKEFAYKNVMEIPKLEKIVVCMGLGEVKDNSKSFNLALDELTQITGQKIGAKVTLRGNTMYEFLDRLISIALPRVRDFKGVNPKAFDGRGNYALGIKEQLIFPEISYEKVDKVRGMDVIIVTTAKTDKEAFALLQAFGMPFAKR